LVLVGGRPLGGRTLALHKKLAGGKLATLGVLEDETFVGTVAFGGGATPMLHRPFGLGPDEVCELVQVALGSHRTPVSRILAITMRMLRRAMPGLGLVVSFADTGQGHHGGICGVDLPRLRLPARLRGGWTGRPPRTFYSRYGAGGQSIGCRIITASKHKYAKALPPIVHGSLAAAGKAYPASVM
jgi:hypothetical protein